MNTHEIHTWKRSCPVRKSHSHGSSWESNRISVFFKYPVTSQRMNEYDENRYRAKMKRKEAPVPLPCYRHDDILHNLIEYNKRSNDNPYLLSFVLICCSIFLTKEEYKEEQQTKPYKMTQGIAVHSLSRFYSESAFKKIRHMERIAGNEKSVK